MRSTHSAPFDSGYVRLYPGDGGNDRSLGAPNGVVQTICERIVHWPQVGQRHRLNGITRPERVGMRSRYPSLDFSLKVPNFSDHAFHLGLGIQDGEADLETQHRLQFLFGGAVIPMFQSEANAGYSIELRTQPTERAQKRRERDLRSEARPAPFSPIGQEDGEKSRQGTGPTPEGSYPARPARPCRPIRHTGATQHPALGDGVKKRTDPIDHDCPLVLIGADSAMSVSLNDRVRALEEAVRLAQENHSDLTVQLDLREMLEAARREQRNG